MTTEESILKEYTDETTTALIEACKAGQLDAVRLLIDKGADVNLATKKGYTPIMVAAMNGHKDILSYLIQKGANVNAITKDGRTALEIVLDLHQKTQKLTPLLS